MLLSIIFILICVTIHEFAHAWVADQLGDPTAKLSGRLTLNPLSHLDPIGTIALFLFGFGWGKPVPIEPYNLKEPKRDEALIALAGPGSNLIVALITVLIFRFVPGLPLFLVQPFLVINLALGFFNLLPVYPLDGSKIVLGLLPLEIAEETEEFLTRYSLIFLILLFLPLLGGRSLVDLILTPLINFSLQFLLSPGLI